MPRVLINYSYGYDWLVRGRPDEDWHEPYERGLAFQAAARAAWALCEAAVFAAFESCGLRCWETWPAYPVHLPPGIAAFKDPLTFGIRADWDAVWSELIHELCHVHEDYPANRELYDDVLTHIRALFPDEDEGVQYHLITCTLQQAVLMQAFPKRWPRMLGHAKGSYHRPDEVHPILRRTWELIEQHEATIDWRNPLGSLLRFA